MTNEEKIKLIQKLQSGDLTNEQKIELIQKLQNSKPVETPKKGFFQRIKDSVNEAYEREKALEAADPIAYRQMKAMEKIARNQRDSSVSSAEEARLRAVQLNRNSIMKAALMSNNPQLMRSALISSLN